MNEYTDRCWEKVKEKEGGGTEIGGWMWWGSMHHLQAQVSKTNKQTNKQPSLWDTPPVFIANIHINFTITMISVTLILSRVISAHVSQKNELIRIVDWHLHSFSPCSPLLYLHQQVLQGPSHLPRRWWVLGKMIAHWDGILVFYHW